MHQNQRNRLTVKVGTEGPKHDPYRYEEVTVRLSSWNGIREIALVVTCHIGLALWIKVGEIEVPCNEETYNDVFEKLTGDTAEGWIEQHRYNHQNDIKDPMGCLADYV